MRLLWILPYTPTPIRTRPYNLLRSLLQRGHDLTLCAVYETPAELLELERLRLAGVRLFCQRLSRPRLALNLALALPGWQPLQSRYSWLPGLARQLRSLLARETFAAVHVEHLRGARYALAAQAALASAPQPARVVWDSVDCISHLFEQAVASSRSGFGRWVTRFELPRTRRYERALVAAFDTTLVTSHNDRLAFEGLSACSLPGVQVLPNGVDLEYFRPSSVERHTEQVLFTGKLSYHANLSAALHLVRAVMPLVWAERPAVRLVLAGKDPAPLLRQLALGEPRLEVTGTLPDLRPCLQRATLAAALVPYGAGIQNKVLEALACGTPVVASSQAASGLHPASQDVLLVRDGAQAQAAAILELLRDPALQRRLSVAGRRYVEAWHDWGRIAMQLEGVYRSGREII